MFGLGIVVGFGLCLLAVGIVLLIDVKGNKGKGDNNEDSRQD